MFDRATGGSVAIGDTNMEYVVFGSGKKDFIMLPGLSDGLRTVKGSAMALAMMYRCFAKDYRVYVFSRKDRFAKGYGTKDMAKDQYAAMEKLGISRAALMGISQGGMVAQHLAIDYPEAVDKLVLAVTAARPNELMRQTINAWIRMAQAGDYKSLFIDTTERSYSEAYIQAKQYRLLYPVMTRIGKPKDFRRFLIEAEACLSHNAHPALHRIGCPTLVVGGEADQVLGGEASMEIAEEITGSKLLMYPGLGHAAYEEAKDFNAQVLAFLRAQA